VELIDTPANILKQYWGYENFRPLQEEIILSALEGRDTLALMPTGGGKSICFQVPALCREGICIVVSPLIALMKDQVFNLRKRDIPAEAIYSGMHYRDIDRILDNCVYGNVKLLYLSPERLTTDLARERIKKMKVNLLAVDEAHCVSQWGYDFRPPYLQIAEIRELLPDAPVLALTATATQEVVLDIQDKLNFRKQNVFSKSFSRENLAYVVLHEEGKDWKLLDILQKVPGSGVVYVRNRRRTKEIALFLRKHGISADFYHAGLNSEERSQKQEAWITGNTRVMVSTNAFGMGIDKADVRVVVHMDLPDSLEAYFQEAGRAGRDGKKSYAVLLYNDTDRRMLERQYELAFPPMEEIRQVYRALGSYFQLAVGAGKGQSFDFDIVEFCENFQLKANRVFNCLKILEQANWLVVTEAVFSPSSLRILVSKDDLYDYQLRHPKMDAILKTILRSFQGAFSHYINLREKQLAGFLKMNAGELIKALQLLNQEGIIEYNPQKDKPQIMFLQERVDAANLVIDMEMYRFRKSRHLERIQKAIAYAEQPVCRSRQLLKYFGENDPPLCGVCDVCTGRTKPVDLTADDFEKYKQDIRLLLKNEPLALDKIMESFPPKTHEQVLKALEYLLDEGFLEKKGERVRWASA
jgi:ATP-dependent DNA helicase RecQ